MLNSSEIELVISYTIAHQCQVGVGLIMGELNLGFENHDGLCNSMNLDSNQWWSSQSLDLKIKTWTISYNPNLVDASNFINSKMLAFSAFN